MGQAGVLLDRDGTINVDYRYVGHISRFQFIEGAPGAIARFNRAGIPVAVITNQSGIARGYYGVEDFWRVQDYMMRQLALHGAHIDFLAFSPHHPDGVIGFYREDSPDHKPHPGMALKAAAELGLDLSASWVVGDRAEDVALAQAVGAHAVTLSRIPGAIHFPSLGAAAPFIISQITGTPMEPVFPGTRFPDPSHYIDAYREELARAFRSVEPQHFRAAALAVQSAYRSGNRVFTCGNGGAASVANHFHCDHSKGVRQGTDLAPKVISLAASVEMMTAIANDIGYDAIFAYQLESLAEPGDLLAAFSVSGTSPSIVRALQWASENGMQTIAVTGCDGGEAARLAGISLHVASSNYGIVEDVQQSLMHALAQFARQSAMPPEAIASSRF
jgi:D,D-heptose 1,7-bisphosphate phosphatase